MAGESSGGESSSDGEAGTHVARLNIPRMEHGGKGYHASYRYQGGSGKEYHARKDYGLQQLQAMGARALIPRKMMPAWSTFHFWNLGSYEEGQLPKWGIAPKTREEIQKIVKLAQMAGLRVNTKVHGHSYAGTSAAGADLLVAMSTHFNKTEIENGTYKDSCGTSYSRTAKVGAGTSWIEFYKALGPNYTSVGGACDSVSAAGGWLLNNGLGLTSQRLLGLGIDNVLEFEVVLADGSFVKADKCNEPDLFRTLKGGGPGFGITTSVRYKLHDATEVQEFQLGWKRSKCNVYKNSDDFWDLVIKHSFPDNRWALWPAQHMDTDEFGAKEDFKIWMYFLGPEKEAKSQLVYKDFLAWASKCPKEAVINSTKSFASFQAYKIYGDIVSAEMSGVRNYKDPGQNGNFPYFGNRLIPAKLIREKPLEARKIFQLIEGKSCDNFYHMGGKITESAGGNGAGGKDSVSHYMRESAWQVGLCDSVALKELRRLLPAGAAGIGQNHQGWHEPQWQETIWGSEKYRQLMSAKRKYDPKALFKCRHCIGAADKD